MEFCLPNTKTKVHPFSSPSNYLTPFFKISSVQQLDNGKLLRLSKLKCVKESSGSKLEWKIEDEMDMEKELVGMRRLKEKCKGISGIVELLECLEREAIMGEDEGKEATDYNRRAQIFDKSSRVFQALKEKEIWQVAIVVCDS